PDRIHQPVADDIEHRPLVEDGVSEIALDHREYPVPVLDIPWIVEAEFFTLRFDRLPRNRRIDQAGQRIPRHHGTHDEYEDTEHDQLRECHQYTSDCKFQHKYINLSPGALLCASPKWIGAGTPFPHRRGSLRSSGHIPS